MKISRADWQLIRTTALNDLYFFEKFILDYKDMVPHVHGPLCNFMQNTKIRKKQVTLPRGFLKTTTSTIGRGLWLACRTPDIRILIASSVVENSRKMIGSIRHHVETNPRIRKFFPEIVPDNFNKSRWSDQCAAIRRPHEYPEGTWEAMGVGGSVISRHYDHIIEDDLIYPKKDDLTGFELMPSRDDIEKAIGWHRLAPSLLINPGKGCIDNIGTRWAPYDLINYITKKERGWRRFMIKDRNSEGQPSWPERFPEETLLDLLSTQGPYFYNALYGCEPMDPSSRVFQKMWLQPYSVLPYGMRYFTTVDLAEWDQQTGGRGKQKAYNVILTCGVDWQHHFYIARYDRGRFTPTQVVEKIAEHVKAFNVEKVGIEVVYYQKAILEEVKRFYERTGIAFPVAAYSRDPRLTKDARIRGLQPVAANGALHYREDMEEFIEEYEDYPMSRTVDILDALSDQLKIASFPDPHEMGAVTDEFDIEAIVEAIKRNKGSQYPISSRLVSDASYFASNPFNNN